MTAGSIISARIIADKLAAHNRWRRGDEAEPSPDPTALGVTIDQAVAALRTLSEKQSELDNALALIVDHARHGASLIEERDAIRARVAELESEDASRELHRDLLRRVAVALNGPEDDLVTHGWSDLPEIAAALRARLEAP